MRTYLSLAFILCGLGLSAAATTLEDPTFRTRTDGHKLSVQFINLEQHATFFTIARTSEPNSPLFQERIEKHNGHRNTFDLSNLSKGRYIMKVEHDGETYQQIVRVSENGVWVSDWK